MLPLAKTIQYIIANNAQFLIPIVEPVSRLYIGWKYHSMDAEAVFTQIYKKNYWGGESRSGPGSDLDQTKKVIKKIQEVLKVLKPRSILDIPCGDFNWQRYVNFGPAHYIGADIVPHIVENNNRLFANHNMHFEKLNIVKDTLPKCDLLLCRDLFQHLSLEDIEDAISNIKQSGCKFLLASSQTGANKNHNIPTGGWRKVNLLKPPFSFPKPLHIIEEECPIKHHADKKLLLWRIKDLENRY